MILIGEVRIKGKTGRIHSKIRITASMSDVSNIDMMHFPKLIQEVQRALTYRIEMPQVAVHIYNMKFEIEIEKRISLRQLEYSEKLRDAIRDMDMEAAAESIRRIWQRLTSHINTPGNTWTVFSDLLDIVNTEMGKKESAERISAEFQTNPEQLVRLDIDYSNLQQQLVDYMFALFERYRESMDNRQNPSITRAKEYVMRHYSETITLDDVAKAACLSSSYFSTLFKTETGVGFEVFITSKNSTAPPVRPGFKIITCPSSKEGATAFAMILCVKEGVTTIINLVPEIALEILSVTISIVTSWVMPLCTNSILLLSRRPSKY